MDVKVERILSATPEKLYAMWTDPKLISTWMGVKVEIEPKVGGYLKIDFGEKELTTGYFKQLDPFKTVAFTWNSYNGDQPTGETLVTVQLVPVDSNKTKMTLHHTGFKTEFARAEHDAGWNDYYNSWEKKLGQ